MRINSFRSLQGKFTLYLTALIVTTMSAIAYWNISREKALMEKVIVREGEALIESFAISCTNTMLYEEIGLVEEGGLLDNFISDLMQRRDLNVIYAMILDPKGKVLAHNSIREVGDSYGDEVTERGITSWDTLLQYPSRNVLDISTPLAISTKRWGTLRMGISLENLKKEISSLVVKYILYTCLFILLAIIVIAFLFRLITRPLKLLTQEMDETNPGEDPPTLSVMGQDEIGILRRSFYRLLRRIKEDEKERERTQRSLLLTEKMVAIGKLTAGVAHEINNPLGGLLNCIYHFKRGGLSPERQHEYFHLMEDGIKRIQNTVTNLLEFARTPKLERTTTDMVSLVEKALSLLDYQLRKSRIEVTKDISLNLPSIEVDRNQMGQVFVNILLNAIQAMEERGVLEIGARTLDERLIMTISDTGKGIPETILPKVFDPFFTTKGEGRGTGLGLWISQGIVERHGGTIQIASREMEGTTVEIQLPLHSNRKG
jgi:two-component system, NtrC family, sensor kinase